MVCPKCASAELKVVEKRNIENEPIIRRRRECTQCGFRFTTYERLEVPSLIVLKKNGQKEPYSREKLSGGIYRALEKRKVDEATAEGMIAEIEKDLRSRGENELASTIIGDIVMQKLFALDQVAYLRFASVYKSFDSLESFAEELKEISKK